MKQKVAWRQIEIVYEIWPSLGKAVNTNPKACRGVFFRISVLGKLKIFMIKLFLIFTGIFNLHLLRTLPSIGY